MAVVFGTLKLSVAEMSFVSVSSPGSTSLSGVQMLRKLNVWLCPSLRENEYGVFGRSRDVLMIRPLPVFALTEPPLTVYEMPEPP
jgi:hypothetical protein